MISGRKFPADVPRGYAVIEREARRIRALFGLSPTDPLPGWELLALLRRLPVVVKGRRIPVDYEVQELGPGVEAEARYREGQIIITLSVETNEFLEQEHPRARFSVPHEFGHAALHALELVRLSEIPHPTAALLRGRFDNLRPFQEAEWQANTFAAAMLMPAEGLAVLSSRLGYLDVDVIREHFRVSAQCAEIRYDVFRRRKSELLGRK